MTDPADLSPADRAKRAAARRAAQMVEDGMRVGLGTGSTATWAVRHLAERMRGDGLRPGPLVATSKATEALMRAEGLAISDLDSAGRLDMTIDGADEVGPGLALIKGGGAALLREKIVAAASDRLVIVADASKSVERLGAFPLPVEVVRFGWRSTMARIDAALDGEDVMGRDAALRPGPDGPLVTDEGHHIVDLSLARIGDPRRLALVLSQIPGVVEHGLFVDMADVAILGLPGGGTERRGPDGRGRNEPAAEPGPGLFGDLPD